jgi:glycolate oxidase
MVDYFLYNKISRKLEENFREIVGEDNCFSDYEIRWTYAFGGSIFENRWVPELVILPQNAIQISKIVMLANEHRIPITPRGSGTSLSAGHLAAYGGIIIDLSQMNQILSIEIANNLVIVEPGVICDDLNEKLKKFGYFFPPDPGSSSVCSIGGMVASNAGGIQAFKYGVTKDYVLFVEIILANGRILTFGSKTLKSVSSYNIKDLFVGSEGSLGIISKIGLRIKPLPSKRKLGFYIFDRIEDLQEAVIELRVECITPILIEFLDKTTSSTVFEYLGGSFFDFPRGYVLICDLDGNFDNDLEDQLSTLHKVMINHQPIFNKLAETDKEREDLINARKAALPALARRAPSCCIEDCTIQITRLSDIIHRIELIPTKLKLKHLKIATFGHMDGNLHPTFLFNENDDEDVKDFELAVEYLYKEIILPGEGTLTGEHGIGKIKTPFLSLELDEEILNLMRDIKNVFDPNHIFNPGIGKGDLTPLKLTRRRRSLKGVPEKTLELNCIRCGFCNISCPSRMFFKSEAHSPRGRLSILNGLVYGDITLENKQLINEILHSCTLCGSCLSHCPASVNTHLIFEKAREILHEVKSN